MSTGQFSQYDEGNMKVSKNNSEKLKSNFKTSSNGFDSIIQELEFTDD